MKRLLRAGTLGVGVVAILLAAGCAPKNLATDRAYYIDNNLAFNPARIWRLHVKWIPDPKNDKRAILQKTWRFDAISTEEQKNLTRLISQFPSQEEYFNWLESRLIPLERTEKRVSAVLSTIDGHPSVVLAFESMQSIPRIEKFRMTRLDVPDPFLQQITRGCVPGERSLLPGGEEVGLEVSLESYSRAPQAQRWPYQEANPTSGFIRRWSVGERSAITYRAVFTAKQGMSNCPLPPDFLTIARSTLAAFEQETGIQW